ncbi:hypothetical protein C0W80_15825 [Photobacterium leiognathi subsp. mandapamensis]|uniref:hypothetical protein n=1 Tax=Photobacterium leiognathi TaxID=553611 RepID=UPI000D15484C|nr:hypothetical protein [Photobacterium leiognathi]PSU98022.1 hypothetical protein C0W80_15825 [Photobacterium leiognathi subsp. mandapamensis]
MNSYYFDNETFKSEYITTIKKFLDMYDNDKYDEGYIEFDFTVDELIEAKIIDRDEGPDLDDSSIVITESEHTSVLFKGFKSEYGYICSDDDGYIQIPNADLVKFFKLESESKIIDDLELYHPNIYLQRVSIEGIDEELLNCSITGMNTEIGKQTIALLHYENFLFSYKLYRDNHLEPLACDKFIEIRGDSLDLEECRAIVKSYIFEINCLTGAVITPESNLNIPTLTYLDDEEIERKKIEYNELAQSANKLLICSDTEKVIDIYNKGNSCLDDEMSILYFSKVIEYVSETVVRAKVTEEGRKALSSNRARVPDANFIKELQELFQNNTYKKDSESMKLTILTCCYINDLTPLVPSYIEKKYNTKIKKSSEDALSFIASCISSTRNNIAHAKANYRATGDEIPEQHYAGFKDLLRIISQQCIRWYAAQSSSMRIAP